MDTNELVTMERGLWARPGPWLAATALPTAWFIVPGMGLTDRNALQQHASELDTGLEVTDARVSFLTEDVVLIAYRATSRQKPAGDRFLCTSTYVKSLRSWNLAHHQRTAVT